MRKNIISLDMCLFVQGLVEELSWHKIYVGCCEPVNCIYVVWGDDGKKGRQVWFLGHYYFYYLHIYKNLSIAGGDRLRIG